MNNQIETRPTDLDLPMPSPVQTELSINMDALAKLIAEPPVPPVVPEIAIDASKNMRKCFELLAADIENLAKDGVARAERQLQEALSYASVIRQAGEALCAKMENEAVNSYQLSTVLRGVRDRLQLPPETVE